MDGMVTKWKKSLTIMEGIGIKWKELLINRRNYLQIEGIVNRRNC